MAKRAQAVVVLILCISTARSLGAAEDVVELKLRPEFGDRRTMCVTWRMVASNPKSGRNEQSEQSKIVVAQFEPVSLAGDDVCTFRVGLQRVCHESVACVGSKREVTMRHDSADRAVQGSWWGASLVAFVGETFTARLSPQGRLLALDTDAFYAAVAKNRVQLENDAALDVQPDPATARRLGFTPDDLRAMGERRVKAADARYGSRGRRLRAYREEAATTSFYNLTVLHPLLNDVAAPLPDRPVKPGDQWKAPVTIELVGPLEMVGTYTLKSIGDEVCIIEVEARPTVQDEPVTDARDSDARGLELEGTYEATLTVERTTGWLLRREAVMNLTGTVPKPGPPGAAARGTIPATVKVTLTAGPPE